MHLTFGIGFTIPIVNAQYTSDRQDTRTEYGIGISLVPLNFEFELKCTVDSPGYFTKIITGRSMCLGSAIVIDSSSVLILLTRGGQIIHNYCSLRLQRATSALQCIVDENQCGALRCGWRNWQNVENA